MKLPKIVRQLAPIVESLLFVVLFCSLLGCTTALIEYLDAQRSPQSILKTFRFFQESTKSATRITAPQALFDGQIIKKTILGLLDKAQPKDNILITTFIMTDSDIAQAIIKRHLHDVNITVIADNSHAEKDYSKVTELIKAGIPVYLHNPCLPDIMHNKFWIFEFACSQPIVLTGSYNPTNSAATKNAENIVIIGHPETIKDYKINFAQLLEKSIRAELSESKKACKNKPF